MVERDCRFSIRLNGDLEGMFLEVLINGMGWDYSLMEILVEGLHSYKFQTDYSRR